MTIKSNETETVIGKNTAISIGLLLALIALGAPVLMMGASVVQMQTELREHRNAPAHSPSVLSRTEFEFHRKTIDKEFDVINRKLDQLLGAK